tara:strand:- start:617 stop:2104 length:1488 start_codon:yes stop_codon:yes gene_type:complete
MFVNIKNSIQLVCLIGAFLLPFPRAAQAQMQENCTPAYEAIIPLRNPNFNNLFMWRRVVGRTGYDWVSDYAALDDGYALSVGVSSADIHDDAVARDLSIIRYDNEGQIVRERQVSVDDLEDVVRVLRDGDNIYVGADFKGSDGRGYVQIMRMNFDGEDIQYYPIKEADYDLTLSDMLFNSDGDITLTLKHVKRDAMGQPSSVFYTLDKKANIIHQRQYLPGTPNYMVSVGVNMDGSYLGSGAVEVGRTLDGEVRLGGWIVNLDKLGAVYWQKSFARGAKAELVKASNYSDVGVVSVGTAWPSITIDQAVHSSLWVMMSDTTGEPKWQRFITGRKQYSYSAVDMHLFEDGRISVLANAIALEPSEKVRSHIRLITFSPQGTILQDQAFVEGAESMARRMHVLDNGSFRIAGQLYTGYAPRSEANEEMLIGQNQDGPNEEAEEEKSALQQLKETTLEMSYHDKLAEDEPLSDATLAPVIRGWLLAVEAPMPYKNPCR